MLVSVKHQHESAIDIYICPLPLQPPIFHPEPELFEQRPCLISSLFYSKALVRCQPRGGHWRSASSWWKDGESCWNPRCLTSGICWDKVPSLSLWKIPHPSKLSLNTVSSGKVFLVSCLPYFYYFIFKCFSICFTGL